MSDELKPCQSCGEQKEVYVFHVPFHISRNGIAVVCCNACGQMECAPASYNPDTFADEAIIRWNAQSRAAISSSLSL